MKKLRRIGVFAAASTAAIAMFATPASAATTTVTPTDIGPGQTWEPGDNRPVSSYEITSEYGAPAGLGHSALKYVTTDAAGKAQLGNDDAAGSLLSDVTTQSYWTYRDNGLVPNQVPSINVAVDINGGALELGDFTTLVFEPVYNTDQGAIVEDTWQQWDAYNGGDAIWWSTRPIPGVCAFTCYVSWNDIVEANPNATILGVLLNQGSGNPGLEAATDGYTLNSTTYNFEFSSDDCKKGGWQTNFAPGTFKNQGDCVSFYTSN